MTAPAAMTMRAFRFDLDPTTDQQHALSRHFGAAAFNHALARKVDAHRQWRHQVDELVAAGVSKADARAATRWW